VRVPVVPHGLDQSLDLLLGQVLAGAQLGVGCPGGHRGSGSPGPNCSVIDGWDDQPQARSRQGNLLGFGRDWSVAGPSMMSTVIGGGITGNGLRDGNQVPETVRGAPGREVGSHRPRTGSTASWATVGPRVSALGTEAITRRVLIRPSGPASGLTLGRSEARRIASEMIRRRTHPGCSEDTRRNGSRPPIAP
jgi:hypothetical protein